MSSCRNVLTHNCNRINELGQEKLFVLLEEQQSIWRCMIQEINKIHRDPYWGGGEYKTIAFSTYTKSPSMIS